LYLDGSSECGWIPIEHSTLPSTISLLAIAQDAPNLLGKVGAVHEGERVAIMEQRADGNVRIRTNVYEEGWTRIEALKDVQPYTP
jgi:hypothetical protein